MSFRSDVDELRATIRKAGGAPWHNLERYAARMRAAAPDHLRSRCCFAGACGFGFGAFWTAFYHAPDAALICTGAAFVLTLAGCWLSLRAECAK
jgi:hypothetical protein